MKTFSSGTYTISGVLGLIKYYNTPRNYICQGLESDHRVAFKKSDVNFCETVSGYGYVTIKIYIRNLYIVEYQCSPDSDHKKLYETILESCLENPDIKHKTQ